MNDVLTKIFIIAAVLIVMFPFASNGQSRPDVQWMRGGNASPRTNPIYLDDGQRFVTSSGGVIYIWRTSDGILLKSINAFSGLLLYDLALSPNKRLIAGVGHTTGSGTSVKIYNSNDGSFVREIPAAGSNLAFSPDSLNVAVNSGHDGIIQLWRVSDGALLHTYQPPVLPQSGSEYPTVTGVPVFSPDGLNLVGNGAFGSSLVIVRVSDGHVVKHYRQNSYGASLRDAAVYTPDGQYLIASQQNGASLAVWRLSDPCTSNVCAPWRILIPAGGPGPKNLVFSPNGSMFAMGGGTALSGNVGYIWSTSDWSLIRSFDDNNSMSPNARVVFTPDSTGLLSQTSNIKLWNTADGSLVRNYDLHSAYLNSSAYSPDGQVIASATNTYTFDSDRLPGIYLWSASNGSLIRTLDYGEGALGGVSSIAFSPDSQTLAATGTIFQNGQGVRKIKLFNAQTGSLVRTINGGDGSIVFSPDGQLFAARNGNGYTDLYRVSDGALIRTINNMIPQGLSFSPDSLRITNGGAVYQVSNGAPLFNLSGGAPSYPNGASYSPDGTLIASVSNNDVRLYNAANGVLVRSFIGHTARATVAVFSPDNSAILSAAMDGTVRLWRVSDGSLLQTYNDEVGFPGLTETISGSFSPDGQFFIYGRFVDSTLVKARNPLVPPPPVTTFPTAAGLNVDIDNGTVKVTFASVLQAGDTTILPIDPTATGLALPADHSIPNDLSGFNVSTTAGIASGSTIDVCISVLSTVNAGRFAKLRVLHGEGANLVDRTFSSDFSARRLCGRTTSLSPFVISEYEPSDTTAPVTQAGLSDTPNAAGWNDSDVTITFTSTDNDGGSGVREITYSASGAQPIPLTWVAGSTASVVISAEGVTTVSYFAKDIAGNTESASTLIIKLDRSAPSVLCDAADGTWHVSDVSISCTSNDSVSGLVDTADSAFTLSASVVAGTETDAASTGSRQVCDLARNCSTGGPIGGNKIDKKAPSIAISSPVAGAFLLNQSIAVNYACTDGGSGVATCSGTNANGGNLDTSTAGAKNFTVNSADNVGNASTPAVVAYTVNFGLAVLFDPTKAHKSGSAVPIKIRLVDANGSNVSTASTVVHAVSVIQTSSQASTEFGDAGNSNPDFDFRYDAALGGYIFNLQTRGMGTGSYLLNFIAGGGQTVYSVGFQVRQ